MLMVAQTVVLRRRRGRMVNEGTKEDPSMETSALDPFFFFQQWMLSLPGISCNTLLLFLMPCNSCVFECISGLNFIDFLVFPSTLFFPMPHTWTWIF